MVEGIGSNGFIDFRLTDLVGLEELQKLQDCFASSNNVASVILDPDGVPLTTSSNFSDFCRVVCSSSKGRENCRSVAKTFCNKKPLDTSSIVHCPSFPSLMEAFVPITAGGKCLALWNIGQVVDSSFSTDGVEEQACFLDTDKKDIIESFSRLPRMSREDFGHIISFLELISLQVSMVAVQSLEHKDIAMERDKAKKALYLSMEKLDLVLNGADFAMWDWNLETGEFLFNDRWAEMLEYRPGEIGHHCISWKNLIHSDDLSSLMESIDAHLNGRIPLFKCEYRMKTMRGRWRWFQDSGKVVEWDDSGNPVKLTGTHIDVTEQKMIQDKLRRNFTEQSILLDNIDVQIWYMKDAEHYGRVNMAHADFLGVEKQEIEGMDLNVVHSGKNHLEEIESNRKVIESKEPMEVEEWRTNSRGEDRLLSITRTPIMDSSGDVEYIICTATDMTRRREYEQKLAYMAAHDPLTGCYNRHSLDHLLKKETGRSKRYKHPIELLMIDINRFKEINDIFGHQTGDMVLKEVAGLLQKEVRECDLVVRYGGDEFLIILPETIGQTPILKDRINSVVSDWNTQNNILTFPLSLSIGCAHWDPEGLKNVDDVIAEADKMMYVEKQKGQSEESSFIRFVSDRGKKGTYRRIAPPPSI